MSTAIIKPAWSPLTVALMVLGFVTFWPLGLAMLAYILWGEKFGGSAEKAQEWVNSGKSWCGKGGHGFKRSWNDRGHSASGNAAFDDYRDEQLKRLEEERRKLDQDAEDFREYMRNLRMARDREEFDRFMADRNGNRPTSYDQGNQNGNSY